MFPNESLSGELGLFGVFDGHGGSAVWETQPRSSRTLNTPCKINTEPENDGLEDDFPLQLGDF